MAIRVSDSDMAVCAPAPSDALGARAALNTHARVPPGRVRVACLSARGQGSAGAILGSATSKHNIVNYYNQASFGAFGYRVWPGLRELYALILLLVIIYYYEYRNRHRQASFDVFGHCVRLGLACMYGPYDQAHESVRACVCV